jgi:hypothetical protein
MDPGGIDLHLEIMPQSLERFRDHKIEAELWMWTGSERLCEMAYNFYKTHKHHNLYDFIGVYGPSSINNPNCWRHHAVLHIESKGMKFTNGGGDGHGDKDFDRLFQHYMDSKFTLGTTSHNRPELTRLGCMKGFRDWLGPLLGNVLIYDNHPNTEIFNKDKIVPTYDYDNLDSMTDLANTLKEDKPKYTNYMLKQIDWAWENTIETQLLTIMLKRGWLKNSDLQNVMVVPDEFI